MQPPPQLPHMPEISLGLAAYLRHFAIWCRTGFADTVSTRSAASQLLLASTSGDTVWRVTVDDAGVLQTTRMTPGGGA